MCAACVMAAAAGASGARSWLHTQPWLSARLLRFATIGLLLAAFGVSSVAISGSSAAVHRAPLRGHAPPAQPRQP